MGILSWIVAGAIAGWLTGVVLRGHGFGLLGYLLAGVAGLQLHQHSGRLPGRGPSHAGHPAVARPLAAFSFDP